MEIDHFMYAVPSLDEGLKWATEVFGVAPSPGGAHAGLGTQNALLSLGETYLELIAPDPGQSLDHNFGGRIAELKSGGLVTWAARGALFDARDKLALCGIESAGPTETRRLTPEGETLIWKLLFPRKHEFGGSLPFFIDWLDCEHPAKTNPLAGELLRFEIQHTTADALQQVFDVLDLDLVATPAPLASMSVVILGSAGEVTLTTTPETINLSFQGSSD